MAHNFLPRSTSDLVERFEVTPRQGVFDCPFVGIRCLCLCPFFRVRSFMADRYARVKDSKGTYDREEHCFSCFLAAHRDFWMLSIE